MNYFYGNLDFNNHKVLNVTLNNTQLNKYTHSGDFWYGSLIYAAIGDVTIKNISEFNIYSPKLDDTLKLVYFAYDKNSTTQNTLIIENITITGEARLSDNNTGLFVHYAGTSKVELKNCTNNANIYNTTNTAAFVGRPNVNVTIDGGKYNYIAKDVKFVNCINNGIIFTTSKEANTIVMLISNSNGNNSNVYVENCVNYGQMIIAGRNTTNNVAAGDIQKIKITGEVTGNQIATVSFEKIEVNGDKFIIKSVSGAKRYEMVFSFSGAAYAGGVLSTTFELTKDDLSNVAAYNWKYNTANNPIENVKSENKYGTIVKTVIIDGTTYYVADTANTTSTPVSVVVYAYDASNNIIGYSTYTYTN